MSQTTVVFKMHGQSHEVSYDEGESLLETAIRHDLNPSYSCMEGVCAACLGKVEEGQVNFPDDTVLSEEDVAQGQVLTCQAVVKPGCHRVVINFEF